MINQFFNRDTIKATPWKNGGGVTREIAKSLPLNPFWRLSIANVDNEGPFSIFDGLERVLTVIDGQGMRLVRNIGNLSANLHVPVRFSGSEAVEGFLPNGPIQDFNLIFDATVLNAKVLVSHSVELRSEHTSEPILTLTYCLTGAFKTRDCELLVPHTGVLNSSELIVATSDDSLALCILIYPRPK